MLLAVCFEDSDASRYKVGKRVGRCSVGKLGHQPPRFRNVLIPRKCIGCYGTYEGGCVRDVRQRGENNGWIFSRRQELGRCDGNAGDECCLRVHLRSRSRLSAETPRYLSVDEIERLPLFFRARHSVMIADWFALSV